MKKERTLPFMAILRVKVKVIDMVAEMIAAVRPKLVNLRLGASIISLILRKISHPLTVIH